jgi:flagellar hook protein FlgE
MSFQQGLSGLDAASNQLNVIGNNVSNASTVGFKGSTIEFGDLYASSFYGTPSAQPGIGVDTLAVRPDMAQGNITTTDNNLDLAINNSGYFVVAAGLASASTTGASAGSAMYSRNGQFHVDRNGYLVNASGDNLQGWMASKGVVNQGSLANLQLNTTNIAPSATNTVGMGVNLDSSQAVPTQSPLDPTNPATYNWSNSSTVYDSLGNSHSLTLYYVKNAATTSGTTWDVTSYVDGTATGNTTKLGFTTAGALDTSGSLGGATTLGVSYNAPTANGSTTPMNFTINYANSTQFSQSSGTNTLTNDGYAAGQLSAINISRSGIIQASYTNGQTTTVGQVALANFTNQQGLQPSGNNLWAETYSSGPAKLNAPGSGGAGTIQSSALESSNVDLTTELVNMITAQRYYQANAQTIKTQDSIMQTLVNLQ